MKKLNIHPFLLISIVFSLLVSCSSTRGPLAYRSFAEAFNLHGYCKSNKITSSNLQSADSLMRAADKSIKDDDMEQAYWQSDMAAILYKLSIAESQLTQSQTQFVELKLAVEKDREHLISLSEVFEEIKALRRP
ncbi:MAG: hypothetical protein HQK83_02640 [Fibrobacteria bacterium]|nr:hypothetical protein [Fibrobacteria bacterium]